MDLTIREIAEACGGKLVVQGGEADGDTCVSSVAIDSRLVERQGVFIATVGERVDGHSFIRMAFRRGAALAVCQKGPGQVADAMEAADAGKREAGGPGGQWGCYVLVEDTLQALKDIAEAYRRKLSVKVVGITGSVGKTSTKEFIAGVLAEKYSVLKTEGNFNNEIGVPLTLLSIRREHQVAVVEMGISDFGEMHRLSRMARPDICVMTNIGQSHLNNLIDRDGILRAKSEIFDYMAEDGEICLNGEDDKLRALTEIKGRRPHFFGLGGSSGQEASAVDIVSRGLRGSDATLLLGERIGDRGQERSGGSAAPEEDWSRQGAEQEGRAAEQVRIHVPQPGRHMVLNAAAAACVAGLLDMDGKQIAAGISKVEAVSGRTHIMDMSRYTVIDDCYNANPASVKAAIDLLALADTEKVAILGDMLNLGEDSARLHGEIGDYAVTAGIDRIFCVGEESRHMYRAALDRAGYGEAGLREDSRERGSTGKGRRIAHYPDREALLDALSVELGEWLPEGSTILVKASHDMGFSEILDFLQREG